MLRKVILLILLVSSIDTFAQNSPCENKYWIQEPILETHSQEENGIGGTGVVLPANTDLSTAQTNGEEGIGGTGIVGIITGFGSICVNGTEIEYNDMTPIFENEMTASKKRLSLGQTVSVLAFPNSKEYYAKEIHVLHEVQGKIDSINTTESLFKVLEQSVHLPHTLLEQLSVGETVAVSGNRLIDGSINALRVEQILETEKVHLLGRLEMDAENNFYIGKQSLKFNSQQINQSIGEEISVQGTLQNGVLYVEHLKQNPRWNFSEKVEQVLVQGYVRQSNAREINIDGVRISPDEKMKIQMPKIGERASVWAKETNGKQLILDHLHFIPQLPEKISERSVTHEQSHDSHESAFPFSKAQIMPTMEYSHPEIQEFNFKRGDMPSPPEVLHRDIDKPTLQRLNMNKPDIEKVIMPRSDVEKPTVLRPEIEKTLQPNRPEIEHFDMKEKPNSARPEINHFDLPNRK